MVKIDSQIQFNNQNGILMDFTYIKKLPSNLWHFIAQKSANIISRLFGNNPFDGLTTEISALQQSVKQFETSVIKELTAGSKHDETLQQNGKPFVARYSDETVHLNHLKTANQEYSNRNIFWRIYYYTFIKEQREHYGRAIIACLALSLNNKDQHQACQDFISLCQERVLEFIKESHPLQQLYNCISSTLQQLANKQNASQTPLSTQVLIDPMAQYVEQLKQRIRKNNPVELKSIVRSYEIILLEYTDINTSELKKLQRMIQLKVHPDKNPLCQNEANVAFQYYNSVTDKFNAMQGSSVIDYMFERKRRLEELNREMKQEIAQKSEKIKQMDEQINQRQAQIDQRQAQIDQLEEANKQLRQALLLPQETYKAKSQQNTQEKNTADIDKPESDSSLSNQVSCFKP